MILASLDQGHGVRAHHDWWWDLTYPQAIVVAAIIIAIALVVCTHMRSGRRLI